MKAENVLLSPFKTTNGAVPFDKITHEDYEPAILAGIKASQAEIDAIVNNAQTPDFENTIAALDRCGEDLNRVLGVFYALCEADSDDELLAISEKMTPIISKHSTSIGLNEKLWKRIKYVHDNTPASSLTREQQMLLKKTYDSFVSNGANLEGDARKKYEELTERLSALTVKFSQNNLKDMNARKMWLTANDLDGLPESTIEAAKLAAKEAGKEGEYLITVQAPSYGPFMKYSSRRDLREKLYKLYNTRNTAGEFSNMENVRDIVNTRLEIAKLMGYKSFADYHLQHTMAGNPTNVYNLLNQLKDAYMPAMKKEVKEIADFASKVEGKKMELKPWDYSYYFNKLKDSKFSINDELLRPYFEINNVIKGVFGLASRLYDIDFVENFDAQVFNPEVRVFDVREKSGKLLGLLYVDFYPRATKRSGAWMTNFSEQCRDAQGNDKRPLVSLTCNFTAPTETKPALLTFGEVETFMHEFGHGLHGLFAEANYMGLSGTNVYHDFVELPSQFNENFLTQQEFLNTFAFHYETGEVIPKELVDNIIASSQFGAAYQCVRQLSFGLLDMAWHTLETPFNADPIAFESTATTSVEVFAPIEGCAMSPQFGHIFSGGYAAGYYGYKWAEVLDADAFEKFLETGIFNTETAHSFRDNILRRGGTDEPMTLYKAFRGKEPSVNALMKRDGIKK